ncbi:MAG: HNH endonuclease [Phycisphaerales bacterium]|nr:HNH endonuclease [Phycisphaerales bacterium]
MTALHGALDSQVLVLNRLYSAVRVVDARRAFCLLVKNIAEVIAVEDGTYRNYDWASWADIAELHQEFEAESHDFVKTTRLVIAVPKVIRLLSYDRRPRRNVKLNRRNIYARDASRCQYCGKRFATPELTLDHVTPRVQGGENSWENLVCACVKCNARKGGRTPKQAGMRLVRAPVRPRHNPTVTLRLGPAKYDTWKTFLDEAYWTVELI